MASSDIKTLNDLGGKRVAVVAGTSNEQAVETVSKRIPMTLVRVKDRAEGIAALEGGKADAYASDKLLLIGAKFTDPKAIRLLPDDLSIEPYAIVLPRGDWALRLAVNTALANIIRGGEITFIFNTLVRVDRLAAGRPDQRDVPAQRAGRLSKPQAAQAN